jgi:hypothetical protein
MNHVAIETNIHNVKTELITLVRTVNGIMEHMWSVQHTEVTYEYIYRTRCG